jgi:hypothetical protein
MDGLGNAMLLFLAPDWRLGELVKEALEAAG